MNRLDYKSSRLLGFKKWQNGRFLPNSNQDQLQQRMALASHGKTSFRSQDLFFLLRNSNNSPSVIKVKNELVNTIQLMRSKSKEQKVRLLDNMTSPPYSTVTRNRLRNSKRKKAIISGKTFKQHTDANLTVPSHFKGGFRRSNSRTLRKHMYTHIG
ncbi:hypothetical protein PHET_12448 [Paragonimus heterotremus]|uniref:Uncharacterized protein n=1 Tax=Paragonimus heterotremus TaxID=100268 RepID=A0A8J4WC87_9TREM|nr:hypothetical protein PHET_12448 [Paragonimus heterotremus]